MATQLDSHCLADESPVAAEVARGVTRLFCRRDLFAICEMPLANGRRADLMAIDASGGLTIVEIKSSVTDFRTDQKWPDYESFCDAFYFAVPDGLPLEILPDDRGLIVADSFDAAILREARRHPLSGARRKAVTLSFARSAAGTLHALADPHARLDLV